MRKLQSIIRKQPALRVRTSRDRSSSRAYRSRPYACCNSSCRGSRKGSRFAWQKEECVAAYSKPSRLWRWLSSRRLPAAGRLNIAAVTWIATVRTKRIGSAGYIDLDKRFLHASASKTLPSGLLSQRPLLHSGRQRNTQRSGWAVHPAFALPSHPSRFDQSRYWPSPNGYEPAACVRGPSHNTDR